MQTFSTEAILHILQQELPTLFQKDLTYDIYAPDITFQDPINQFRGRKAYRLIFWALRFHGRLFFTHLVFNVHQLHAINAYMIIAEWTVEGTLRLPWRPQIYFTGNSTYTIHQGLIDTHTDAWNSSPKTIFMQFFKPLRS
jgi:hypothetical protein